MSLLLSATSVYRSVVASQAFIDLREQLARADERLASARRAYNNACGVHRDIADAVPAGMVKRLRLPASPDTPLIRGPVQDAS